MSTNITTLPDIEQIKNTDEYQKFLDTFNLAATKINNLQDGLIKMESLIGFPISRVNQNNISDLVDAINKTIDQVNVTGSWLGDIQNLTTDQKVNITYAVNWLNAQIGDLDNLTTTDKDNIVSAINWLHNEIVTINTTKSTETVFGLVENATQDEVDLGVKDDNYAISPNKLKNISVDSDTIKGIGAALSGTNSLEANVTSRGLIRLANGSEVDLSVNNVAALTPKSLSLITKQQPLANALAQAIFQSVSTADTEEVYWDTTKPVPVLMVKVDGNYIALGSDYANTGSIQNTDAFTSGAQATEIDFGVAKIATQSDVDDGSLDTKILTPAKLKNLSHGSSTAEGIIKALFGQTFGLDSDSTTLKISVDANADGTPDPNPALEISKTGDLKSFGDVVWKSQPNQLVVGLNAEKLGGKTHTDFVLKTTQVSTGDGLLGGGDLSANRNLSLDYPSQAEAEAATDNIKPMTALRVKNYFEANGGKDLVEFYGVKVVNGKYQLTKGRDDFVARDYIWWDILPLNTQININEKGHLVIGM